ncbi:MAG TPA: hypothetical protein VLL05_18160 [Terriglobales bacterium]|nr:hypothetical protein [Terriglobales bacterium]
MSMKIYLICCVLVCALCMPLFAQSQTGQYQPGKVTEVDKLPVKGRTGGTDAPLKAHVLDHDVSIQVGDTVYVGRYHAQSAQELSWLRDSDVQVRIKGKAMYVKNTTGKDAKVSIVRTTKAGQS